MRREGDGWTDRGGGEGKADQGEKYARGPVQRQGGRTVSQLGGEDVLGGDEKLLSQVRGFCRTI